MTKKRDQYIDRVDKNGIIMGNMKILNGKNENIQLSVVIPLFNEEENLPEELQNYFVSGLFGILVG